MTWIDHREMKRLPRNGQEVWYYLPEIGVFRGHFRIDKDPVSSRWCRDHGISTNLFVCSEVCGCVDSDDVPCWMPYEEGSARPTSPQREGDCREQEARAV